MADNENPEDPESAEDKSDIADSSSPSASGTETVDDDADEALFRNGCLIAILPYVGYTLYAYFIFATLAGYSRRFYVHYVGWWTILAIIYLIPVLVCTILACINRSTRITMVGRIVGMLIIFGLEIAFVNYLNAHV
jgi:hypothetical protein